MCRFRRSTSQRPPNSLTACHALVDGFAVVLDRQQTAMGVTAGCVRQPLTLREPSLGASARGQVADTHQRSNAQENQVRRLTVSGMRTRRAKDGETAPRLKCTASMPTPSHWLDLVI